MAQATVAPSINQRAAQLVIVRTSEACVSYRLMVDGRIVWSNRVYGRAEGYQGARRRMAEWALKHGVRIVESERRWRA